MLVGEFGLEREEEALHGGAIVAVGFAAHRRRGRPLKHIEARDRKADPSAETTRDRGSFE
jgi:hypothetical protein